MITPPVPGPSVRSLSRRRPHVDILTLEHGLAVLDGRLGTLEQLLAQTGRPGEAYATRHLRQLVRALRTTTVGRRLA